MSHETPNATPVVANEGLGSDLNRAIVTLCTAVLPLWARHLATSRSQSEVAVTQMLSAFENIGPHLDLAARQSRQITEALAIGDDGIAGLVLACERELAPVFDGLDPPALDAVKRVLAMIRQSVAALEQVVKPFEHETQMVGQQVERMYMGLQYQDRISQMMSLLYEDMERLQAALSQPDLHMDDLDHHAWLVSLESRYAMNEQRQNHGGPGAAGEGGIGSNETTFF